MPSATPSTRMQTQPPITLNKAGSWQVQICQQADMVKSGAINLAMSTVQEPIQVMALVGTTLI